MEWLRYKLRKWLGLASLEWRFQAHMDNLHQRNRGLRQKKHGQQGEVKHGKTTKL